MPKRVFKAIVSAVSYAGGIVDPYKVTYVVIASSNLEAAQNAIAKFNMLEPKDTATNVALQVCKALTI